MLDSKRPGSAIAGAGPGDTIGLAPPQALEATLVELWRTREVDPGALVADRHGSLRPNDSILDRTTLGDWNAITQGGTLVGEAHGIEAGLELGMVLGEGGMGVVRAGVQVPLRRTVAVKELRPAGATPGAVAALLREAWVSGNLEHPNIVPVHALVPGDSSPRLVMKRIEGTVWADVLERRASPEHDLETHLGVLQNVCRAVHFAHSRGVVHLDLKPDNVMLGRFGEVYLVDWGIAAGLGNEGPAWLPKAADIARVCGTPCSLAPELAAADGRSVGVRTDVYGLGTILHEILTGQPRHDGATIPDVLLQAFQSAPVSYAAGVPRELGAIANKATARDPADRFADAEALRQSIDAFVTHRGAARLTDDALTRLERVASLVTTPGARGSTPAVPRAPADDAALERLIVECRFAFEQALALWPDSAEARDGRRRLLALVIDDAIGAKQWQRAAAYLSELESPSAELVAKVDALGAELAAKEASHAALERLGHETDVNFNRLSRSAFAAICGGLWVVWNLGAAWLTKGPLAPLGYPLLIGSVVATLVMYAAALWIFRRTLLTTVLNRSILALFGGWFVVVLMTVIGAALAGDSPLVAVTDTYKLYVAFCLVIAIFVDRRGGLLSAVAVAPYTIIGPAHPELAFELVAAIGATCGFIFAWSWRRPVRSPFQRREARAR